MFSPSRKAVYFNGKVLPAFNLSMAFLASSLVWGAVGMGMLIYGKRQTSLAALIGGLALIGVSYFASSAWQMNLLALVIITATYFFRRADQ